MTYEELREAIDWDKVRAAVEAHKLPFATDYGDVLAAALKALKKWGPADSEAKILAIEQQDHVRIFDFQIFPGPADDAAPDAEFHQTTVIDLLLEREGVREVVDWKSAGSLDAEWVFDKRASRQWMLYCAAHQAPKAFFRGVQRDGRCRELPLAWPLEGFGNRELYQELFYLHQWRSGLWELDSWPKLGAGRSGCRAFGRDCPLLKLGCLEGTSPKALLPKQHFSYSGMQTFKMCPERYRGERAGRIKEESGAANWGSAFHAAMAEIYGQMRAF